MNPKLYTINEIFFSLQGEGVRAGTANFFVRFSGCNLKCSKDPGTLSPGGFDCDTEFLSGSKMNAADIFARCRELSPDCKNVIFTGGEPALQVDTELVSFMRSHGLFTAIETNGSLAVCKLLDWITVSPKVAEHCIRQLDAHEVKYVRGYGQAIPHPTTRAQNYLISPAFDGSELDAKTLAWCVKLVKDNPSWRLSVQAHKQWGVR